MQSRSRASWVLLHTWLLLFCLLTDFTTGVFCRRFAPARCASWLVLFLSPWRLHNLGLSDNQWTHVVSSWLGNDDNFLTLGIISHRVDDNRWTFLIKRFWFDNFHAQKSPRSVRVEEEATRPFDPAVHGFHRSNIPQLSRFNEWYCLLFGICNHEDEVFDAVFD